MKLVGVPGQARRDFSYYADGAIVSASLPQLILPENTSRSSLFFQNTSGAIMWYGFGSARAHCAITNGGVSSITVDNGGFNFTRPPIVAFYGGGFPQGAGAIIAPNTAYIAAAGPGFPSPDHPAKAHALLTTGGISSIVIDDPGIGYQVAPMVFLYNDPLDPSGCFDPSAGSGSGFQLYPGQSIYEAHSVMTTDPLAVFCATATSTFACRWTT